MCENRTYGAPIQVSAHARVQSGGVSALFWVTNKKKSRVTSCTNLRKNRNRSSKERKWDVDAELLYNYYLRPLISKQ